MRVGDGRYEISCAPQAKLATIAQAYGLQGLLDIEVLAPSLTKFTHTACARGRGRMNAILIIMGKELRDGLRNRWVLAVALLLAVLALVLGFLGSAPPATSR